MPISNGFDTSLVMGSLFGRVKWRSLNPGGAYPLNFAVNAVRPAKYVKAGMTSGMVVGQASWTDSSLIGWNILLEQLGYGSLDPNVDYTFDNTTGIITLLNGQLLTTNQKFVYHFETKLQGAPATGSGRYYEFFHPLNTLENLRNTQGDNEMTDPDFLTFISDLEQGIIMQLLNNLFREPQQCESKLLWDRSLRNDLKMGNSGKFCGYRLNIAPGENAMQVSKASFIFDGAATFNLYLFHDMITDPLFVKSITTVAGQEVYVDLDQWIVGYNRPAQGGSYYLGYFQNDLGGVQALDQFVQQWNESLLFGYQSFEAVQTDTQNFNRIQVPYGFRTYGMNLEVQTYKDFTNRIIKNASLFDNAIGLMMACAVLGYEVYSTRTNFTERNLKGMAELIYSEIYNNGKASNINPYIPGFMSQLQTEIKRITQNFFPDPGVQTTRPAIYTPSSQNLQGNFR